jgi:HAE1 family hydrophobic/amphiphilic exporter-1
VILVLDRRLRFLQNWRATLIPLLTVPVSPRRVHLLPDAGLFHQRPVLLGLVLAIGIVVDDAIVVVEAVITTSSTACRRKKPRSRRWRRSRPP